VGGGGGGVCWLVSAMLPKTPSAFLFVPAPTPSVSDAESAEIEAFLLIKGGGFGGVMGL